MSRFIVMRYLTLRENNGNYVTEQCYGKLAWIDKPIKKSKM